MDLRPRLGASGLFTDPNPQIDVPPGALLRADNVVIRRKDTLEPRPGFKAGTESPLEELYGLLPYDERIIRVGPEVESGSTTYSGPGSTAVYADAVDGDPLTWDRDNIRGVESRGNLYITTTDAVRVLNHGSTGIAKRAGLFAPAITLIGTTVGTGFLDDGTSVSYRIVLKRKDQNGLITSSAPSARMVVRNNAGSARDVSMTFAWRGSTADDTIQIYRSEITTEAFPDDEHFLLKEIVVTASPDGTSTFTDSYPDTALAQALYTNPDATSGTAAASNFRPPACRDLAVYQGSLFFGGITNQARKTITWDDAHGSVTGDATHVGLRTYTGTRTHNGNTITGLSSTVGLQVGMMLSSATNWDSSGKPVVISSIVGSDVGMTANYTGSTDGAPVNITFVDTICIGATNDPANYYRADQAYLLVAGILSSTSGQSVKNDTVVAYGVGDAGFWETGVFLSMARTVTIEAISALDSFTISASHGDQYRPPLNLHTAGDRETVAPEEQQNVIAWSQRDQPEAFHLADFAFVGKASSPVLRILSANDALWVLKGKGDGIYRVSGFGAETGFRIDKAATAYLLHPSLACVMPDDAGTDQVFAWTDKGAVSISDAGVIPLSKPVIGADTRKLEAELDHDSGEGLPAFAVANAKDYEVVFGLPADTLTGDAVTRIYVYNAEQHAWTTWFGDEDPTLESAAYDPASRTLLFGTTESGTPRVERQLSETYVLAGDAEFTIDIDSFDEDNPNLVTLDDEVEGWTPAVGDLIRVGSGFAIITAVTRTHFINASRG